MFILEGAGSAAPAFNEFNPLFTRNRLTLQASGIYGSNETWGDEVVHSGVWDRFSYSVGQFHYETDGFRQNNDVRQELVNGFFQASLSPKLSVQAEVRHEEIDRGDLILFADNSRFVDSELPRRRIDVNSFRAGAHFAAGASSHVIGSFIHQEGDDFSSSAEQRITDGDNAGRRITDGDLGEAQYLLRGNRFNAVAGAGYSNSGFVRANNIRTGGHVSCERLSVLVSVLSSQSYVDLGTQRRFT